MKDIKALAIITAVNGAMYATGFLSSSLKEMGYYVGGAAAALLIRKFL